MKNTIQSHTFPVHFTNLLKVEKTLPEVLFLTTFPPRECGIATYSQDLIFALNNKYKNSFLLKVVALETENDPHVYPNTIDSILITDEAHSYVKLAQKSNQNKDLELVLIQHEFGLFRNNESDFITLLSNLQKPKIIVFHTVLPNPSEELTIQMKAIDSVVEAIIVMTHAAAKILVETYGVAIEKIAIIPHGTHLVEHIDKVLLKEKYGFMNRKVLSTFGLLSSGKSIETTLDALPAIIEKNERVLFLIIGKTHPSVVKNEGEMYRHFLQEKVEKLNLQNHVLFINEYVSLPVLLEYLQLTDIYLFTSKDRNQAVSGTFSYAISCGCPIISTPIPHASEVLQDKTGIIIDFEHPEQLSKAVNRLFENDTDREKISLNGLHKMMPNAWENAAISHATLFKKMALKPIDLKYQLPKINLNHVKKMTTNFGMLQFSVVNQPDIKSGYTLDDNARAMVAMCQFYELTGDKSKLKYIELYLDFIGYCLQPNGRFLNYVDIHKEFTDQNDENLDDSNGRAIWALGFVLSLSSILPQEMVEKADRIMGKGISNVLSIHSPRAMAFIIKGVYLSNLSENSFAKISLINHFANKLVQMYQHESDEKWKWFESYLTYANSILPEALLCAYQASGEIAYKNVAQSSFQFLLSKTFKKNSIKVISNKGWLHNNTLSIEKIGGEQPIDIAYSIMTLSKFYQAFGEEEYFNKMKGAFNWFLGDNHLNQIMYNPCTGGCFDGLEEDYINLNQGAESTVSYLMARLTLQKSLDTFDKIAEYKKRPLTKKTHKELYT